MSGQGGALKRHARHLFFCTSCQIFGSLTNSNHELSKDLATFDKIRARREIRWAKHRIYNIARRSRCLIHTLVASFLINSSKTSLSPNAVVVYFTGSDLGARNLPAATTRRTLFVVGGISGLRAWRQETVVSVHYSSLPRSSWTPFILINSSYMQSWSQGRVCGKFLRTMINMTAAKYGGKSATTRFRLAPLPSRRMPQYSIVVWLYACGRGLVL